MRVQSSPPVGSNWQPGSTGVRFSNFLLLVDRSLCNVFMPLLVVGYGNWLFDAAVLQGHFLPAHVRDATWHW